MLHIATVHWKNDRWIELQRRFLEWNAGEEFRVYAFLNGISGDYSALFSFISRQDIACCSGAGQNHGLKLNLLADVIASQADHRDPLIFLDGDAFPISNLCRYVREGLRHAPLMAVRRDENLVDRQPHPCFSATTVGFWQEIGGDWRPGYCWEDATGTSVTDTGGNLLGILNRRRVEWTALTRSNQVDLHPLWFGIYGGVIYHHGAGFRGKIERLDREALDRQFPIRAAIKRWKNGDRWLPKNFAYLADRIYPHGPYIAAETLIRNRARTLMDSVYDKIQHNPWFWRELAGLSEP